MTEPRDDGPKGKRSQGAVTGLTAVQQMWQSIPAVIRRPARKLP